MINGGQERLGAKVLPIQGLILMSRCGFKASLISVTHQNHIRVPKPRRGACNRLLWGLWG